MEERHTEPRLVVGIGASAGGLESLGRFLSAIEEDLDLAFVLVQHLSPDYPSMMPEILARYTHMPVRNVPERALLEANTVYLVPPGQQPILEGGELLAMERSSDVPHYPISLFFDSLARVYQERAVAIVLSGSGSDGSRGLTSVNARGGLVLAESLSASFSGMPKAAINTGMTHATMVPEAIPSLLVAYRDTLSIERALATCNTTLLQDGNIYKKITQLIHDSYGIDFSTYKQKAVYRRIARRLALQHDHDLGEYLERIKQDPMERQALHNDLLIGVTEFFRDPEPWDFLLEEVIRPDLKQRARDGEEYRVWVAGCSTGEEAYTISHLILSEAERLNLHIPVRVFATDVNERSLQKASEATYSAEDISKLPTERVTAMFTRVKERYIIREKVRRLVLFSTHNLLEDPPFGRIDLSICRNLLIYFNAAAQRRAIAALHFSLRLRGHLFLGPSESLGEIDSEYEKLNKWNIFKKTGSRRLLMLHPFRSNHRPKRSLAPGVHIQRANYYEKLLSSMVGDAALVDSVGQVQHLFGDLSSLLRPAAGPMNSMLSSMCEGGLGVLVSTALKQATLSKENVSLGSQLSLGGEQVYYTIHVNPILEDDSKSIQGMLVRFEHGQSEAAPPRLELESGTTARIQELEKELNNSRLTLQTVVEELEMTNEELQSSNEELHANLEELQSTNEELHSVNEELYSVNSEYEEKLQELSKARRDQENLIRGIDVGIIFVNRDKTLRFFSPQACSFYNLLDQDIGRDLSHITSRVGVDTAHILHCLDEAIQNGQASQLRLSLVDESSWNVKIKPYVNVEQEIEGAIITLAETTELEQLRREATQQRDRITSVLDHVPQGIWETDPQGQTSYVNQFIAQFSGIAREVILEKGWDALIHPEDLPQARQTWEQNLKTLAPFQLRFRLQHHSGGHRWVQSSATPMFDEARQIKHWYGALIDVHDLYIARQELERFNQELEQVVKERTQAAQLSEERLALAGEHGTDGFWDWNLITGEQYLSPKFKALFGYADHEMENKPQSWMDIIFPEDLVRAKEALRAHLEEDKPYDLDVRYQHRDGSTVWVICRGAAQKDAQGRWARMVGTHTDITALKRAQAELAHPPAYEQLLDLLKQVMDSAPFKIWMADPEGTRVYFNETWQKHTGLSQEQHKDWLQYVHPEDQDRLQRQIHTATRRGEPFALHYRLLHTDGLYHEVQEHGVPYQHSNSLRGYVGSTFDINGSSPHYTQKVTSLLGNIAHHFNNLLSGVLMPASLGRMESPTNSSAHHNFLAIEHGAQRAAELCKLLMDTSGEATDPSEASSLRELVQEGVHSLGLAQKKHLHLEWDFDPKLPRIYAPPQQLRRALDHVLNNAVEALEHQPGGVTLRARLRDTSEQAPTHLLPQDYLTEGRYVVLEVSDTGPGIPPANLERIFEPFFTTRSRGRGMGLTATRGALNSMGGAVEVESPQGQGCTLRLWLPIANEDLARPTTELDTTLLASPGTTALVVEHDPTTLRGLRLHLERAGFQVIALRDAEELLERCAQTPPDFALLDYTVPLARHSEQTRALRQRFPQLRIALMSGYSLKHLRSQLDLSLFDAFLPKPFHFHQLNLTLGEMMTRPRRPL